MVSLNEQDPLVDALGPVVEQDQWDNSASERPFDPSSRGNPWEDWAGIMRIAINPPLGSLEEMLHRTPIPPGIDQAEVDVLWKLMNEEISAPCSHYNLELKLLQKEMFTILEITKSLLNTDDDAIIDLKPSQWPTELQSVLPSVPSTKEGCYARVNQIQERVSSLHTLINNDRVGGVYYDVCTLLDWFDTPHEKRKTSSPAHVLPYFGRVLFGVLGLNAQNTALAHIEAVTSRQLAPKFGGSYTENEKTRFRQPGISQSGGAASNAPGS